MTIPFRTCSIHFSKEVFNTSTAPMPCGWSASATTTMAPATAARTLGRMQTQQKFLKAVAKKMLTAANPDKNRRITPKSFRPVCRHRPVPWAIWPGWAQQAFSKWAWTTSTSPPCPVSGRSPYIYLDPGRNVLTLVNTYLNPYVEDRTAEDLHLPVLTSGKE